MTTPVAANTSATARLLTDPPSYAVGWQERLYVPAPAAGTEWSHQVDGRWHERLVSARWTLTTSAVVATRSPELALSDANGVVVLKVGVGRTAVASTVTTFNLMTGYGYLDTSQSNASSGALPSMLIPAGWSWGPATVGLDVGDVESGIVLVVQRFPTDTTAITAGQ